MLIVRWIQHHLISQICIAIVLGTGIGLWKPELAAYTSILGELFIRALKSIAPVLILILIASAIANQQIGKTSGIKPIILLYFLGTLAAAFLSVTLSYFYPIHIELTQSFDTASAPQSIQEVLKGVLFQLVDNPIRALMEGNFLGLVVWGVALGITLNTASNSTKTIFLDISSCISRIITFIIRLAPIGILGLTMQTIANSGLEGLLSYLNLLALLLVAMAIFALIINPLLCFFYLKRNPYPLLFLCLKESGLTAFFTRSSAANIPVNLELCKRLNLDKDIYAISIPLGSAMNTGGAAITVSVLTLAAVHTLNIPIDFLSAFLLAVVSALCACGASGVAGGSLLLIPLAASLFGINNDIAMNIVAIGFMIGVLQDAVETAVNSSSDVFYTAVVCEMLKSKSAKAAESSLNIDATEAETGS